MVFKPNYDYKIIFKKNIVRLSRQYTLLLIYNGEILFSNVALLINAGIKFNGQTAIFTVKSECLCLQSFPASRYIKSRAHGKPIPDLEISNQEMDLDDCYLGRGFSTGGRGILGF